MAVLLSGAGIVLVLVGAGLLYLFHDPATGHGRMLESFNPRRERIGARIGLALVVAGAAGQLAAVLVATDNLRWNGWEDLREWIIAIGTVGAAAATVGAIVFAWQLR